MFGFFKDILGKKDTAKAEAKAKLSYSEMTGADLLALNDDELYAAILERLSDDWHGCSYPCKVAMTVTNYQDTVDEDGLITYFGDCDPEEIGFLPEALEAIGARDHLELYTNLARDCHFDPTNVTEEDEDNIPFSDFEDEYNQLKPLSLYLSEYAREHIEEL